MMNNIPFYVFCLFSLLLGACSSDSKKECTSDGDCPAGRYCQGDKCAFDCTFNEDCPPGYRCTERGRCERGCVPTNNGIEACDLVDNDCDELTDEDFVDLGLACDFGCEEGEYVCSADGSQTECNAPQPAADDSECNGLDDDCDDQTDEDAPDIDCPLQDGVCAGALQTCQGVDGYSACDYGSDYTQDLDGTCDGLDEDCDGQTDEDAEILIVPEDGEWASDGVDNNCNGLVDEPGGVMVPLAHFAGVWIDAFEVTVFENADCSGARYGEAADDFPAGFPADDAAPGVSLYACSVQGIIPSGFLSWHRAQRACGAQGKRLCSRDEWMIGCSGGGNTLYPYGPFFAAGACNDGWGGAGQVVPTGSLPLCTTSGLIYDSSGNLAEWVQDRDLERPGEAFAGGAGYICEFCYVGMDCRDCDLDDPQDLEDFSETSSCDLDESRKYSFPVIEPLPYLGTRCCYEP